MNYSHQDSVLAAIPQHACFLHFHSTELSSAAQIRQTLVDLSIFSQTYDVVVGIGSTLLQKLDVQISVLKTFPELRNQVVEIVRPDFDLWCWLRANERGDLLLATQELQTIVKPNFTLALQVDAFKYKDGRDLTGYEDGTENPQGDDAVAAGIVACIDPQLHGSSFVAVQQWQHHFTRFNSMSEQAQDHMIGRGRVDNEELEDAPESAHVKRTAQENFDPEAFVVRRSMPWSRDEHGGLYFVAFGHSFDAFEAQFRKMLGLEDGIVDALFQISTPLNSAYFWCPAKQQGHLNLSALGIRAC